MSFFTRLGNMINGFLSLFIGKIEEKNPAAVFEAAIQSHKEQFQKLKKAVGNVVYLRNKIQKELESLKQELEQVTVDLDGALAINNDQLALMLLEKKDQLEAAIVSKETELQSVSKQAEDSMEQLRDFEGKIKELHMQKDLYLAKLENAKAREQINDAMNGLSVDASTQALTDVMASIDKTVARADVSAELVGNSIDKQIEEARAAGKKQQQQDRLAAMKRAKVEGTIGTSEVQTEDMERLAALKAARTAGGDAGEPSGGKNI